MKGAVLERHSLAHFGKLAGCWVHFDGDSMKCNCRGGNVIEHLIKAEQSKPGKHRGAKIHCTWLKYITLILLLWNGNIMPCPSVMTACPIHRTCCPM